MKLLHLGLVAGLLLIPVKAAAQESNTVECLSGEFIRKAIILEEAQTLPNYSEPEIGGTRVQRQHSKTFLWGHAKFIDRDGNKAAICQYSNHVGLVAQFAFTADSANDLVNSCTPESCDGKSYWREEYDREAPSQTMIYVCVRADKGIEFPSIKCPVQSTPSR